MGRPATFNTMTDAERVDYHRDLYRKSERHRLARINHSRRRRGAPEIASLAETKLRIPVGER